MDMRQWFKGKNGMMVHWGLYSLLGGEYRGRRVENYAEWIQSYMPIPNAEYEQLAGIFNPNFTVFNQWLCRCNAVEYKTFNCFCCCNLCCRNFVYKLTISKCF